MKGTYKVKETNLFSGEPIVQKKKLQINERQRNSRNGYINPKINDRGRTNLQIKPNTNEERKVRRHGYYNQNQQNRNRINQ